MIKVGKISRKHEILTVEEKVIDPIVNKIKRNHEMTPMQRELEMRQLKASKLWVKQIIEKEKDLLSDIGEKIF